MLFAKQHASRMDASDFEKRAPRAGSSVRAALRDDLGCKIVLLLGQLGQLPVGPASVLLHALFPLVRGRWWAFGRRPLPGALAGIPGHPSGRLDVAPPSGTLSARRIASASSVFVGAAMADLLDRGSCGRALHEESAPRAPGGTGAGQVRTFSRFRAPRPRPRPSAPGPQARRAPAAGSGRCFPAQSPSSPRGSRRRAGRCSTPG